MVKSADIRKPPRYVYKIYSESLTHLMRGCSSSPLRYICNICADGVITKVGALGDIEVVMVGDSLDIVVAMMSESLDLSRHDQVILRISNLPWWDDSVDL